MNESELAITCLDMLIDICKWYPNRLDGVLVMSHQSLE